MTVLVSLVSLLLAPSAHSALEVEAARVPQPALEAEAARFAEAWTGKDTRLLSGFMAEEGIRLNLPGEEHIRIRPRQARAALDAFLDRHAAGEIDVARASLAGGSREKGFAEIRWSTSSPGLPEPIIFTLFVGYSLENDHWTVTEIRVLF
jgi:hypothetical protein